MWEMSVMMKSMLGLSVSLAILGAATSAHAAYVQVDLSPYVNQGFTNTTSWFINGGDFAGLIGSTNGNQGSPTPFTVANVADGLNGDGTARFNNYWFGLDDGSHADSLFGSLNSTTIAIATPNTTVVHILADNTFGLSGATEFSVTFTGTAGVLVGNFTGGFDTKDYNYNCSTTGCDATAAAGYWYVNGNQIGGDSGNQWLQETVWNLPAGFGLQSLTFSQIDGVDGAILAGVTLETGAVPEPTVWALMIGGFGLVGATLRRRSRLAA
jgi:hypothetical protein